MKKDLYALEIYLPGGTADVAAVFESDTPFMAINIGDILNPRLWKTFDYQGEVLRVVKLEHFIWETQGIVKHKIGVFTEAVSDDEGTRLE